MKMFIFGRNSYFTFLSEFDISDLSLSSLKTKFKILF